ncbi:MAG TPA: glycosyltransferase [Pirellulales bacterium]|nr:glycosyltransferase [Pirellulales bacterium]
MKTGAAPQVVIVSGMHLCNNPRVLKEADALDAAGYHVRVLGIRLDAELSRRDAELMQQRTWLYEPVLDFTSPRLANRLARWQARMVWRLAGIAFRRLDRESRWQLGYAVTRLWKRARQLRADLYIAHVEQGLWAAGRLLDEGFRVGVDFEDWYSEDLPPAAWRNRPRRLLQQLESRLLHEAVSSTCTSQAMSEALAQRYGCRPPTVVYNVFPEAERAALDGRQSDRTDPTLPSIYWFSQTLGQDRGLQDLLAALPLVVRPVQVHLRAHANDPQNWIETHVPPQQRSWVHVHPPVPNTEMLSRIVEHDIGFAGEQPFCRNRDLTATNKLFHYLLGGLAVAASDTRGQREILGQCPGAGQLYQAGDPPSLARVLNEWLADSSRLAQARQAALAASARFCWEVESEVLLSSVARALEQPAPHHCQPELQPAAGETDRK